MLLVVVGRLSSCGVTLENKMPFNKRMRDNELNNEWKYYGIPFGEWVALSYKFASGFQSYEESERRKDD
jgi:hypothetical protein